MHWFNWFQSGLMSLVALFMAGCCGPRCEFQKSLEATPLFAGGGEDMILVDMPFEAGYGALCTQGAYGEVSHHARSTMFDVDFDTPNNENVPVFVPESGIAYVHDADPTHNFGIHVNIDLGDGTYLIIAHLSAVFVDNLSTVVTGQLLGYEGTTGASTGDHVHFGRHEGDASLDGIYGTSLDGLQISMTAGGEHVELATTDMDCTLPGGTTYTSLLPTSHWHPNGSLVKTPDDSTVYVIENGDLTPFDTEAAFVSRNLYFSDVALIVDSEKSCYGERQGIDTETAMTAVYGEFPNQAVWILMGAETDPDRYRMLVPLEGWQAVLKSWGIQVSTYDDLYHDTEAAGLVDRYDYAGQAGFRNGSLVSSVEESAVYVMSDNIAMPIQTWDTLLLAGWEDRTVIEIAQDEFDAVVTAKGDCNTNMYCLTSDDLRTCGGPDRDTEGVTPSGDTTPVTTDPVTTDPDEWSDLEISWFTPDNEPVDFITLSGAVTHAGQAESSWETVFNEVQNTHEVTVTVPSLASGDSVRFSVDYLNNGVHNWSCLAPYPPGQVQGSVMAHYNTVIPVGYTTADDPASAGCGLRVTVP